MTQILTTLFANLLKTYFELISDKIKKAKNKTL